MRRRLSLLLCCSPLWLAGCDQLGIESATAVASRNEATGKAVGKDAAAGKATFVSLLGLEGAMSRAKQLIVMAEGHLSPYAGAAENLIEAARFSIARQS